MAVSVQGGVARTHVPMAGKNTGPGFEVHEIDVEQLAASLNAVRAQVLPESGEVTGFTAIVAAAFEKGRQAGLAEAGEA